MTSVDLLLRSLSGRCEVCRPATKVIGWKETNRKKVEENK